MGNDFSGSSSGNLGGTPSFDNEVNTDNLESITKNSVPTGKRKVQTPFDKKPAARRGPKLGSQRAKTHLWKRFSK